MLAERVKEWNKESLERGVQQGMQKGMQKGTTQVLVLQLEKKFGELSPESLQRLNDANEEQVMEWSENILSAQTLGDVFGH